MSASVDLADAVVVLLNAGSYGESFTAERKAFPRLEEEAGVLDVLVTIGPSEKTRAARGVAEAVQNIPVIVRAKTGGGQDVEEARLAVVLGVVESIEDDLLGDNRSAGTWVAVAVTRSEPYDYQKLLDDGVIQSIITMQYKALT